MFKDQIDLNNFYKNLINNKFVNYTYETVTIQLALVEDGQSIVLTALIYSGDGYIPPSVRDSINKEVATKQISFVIDEKTHQIYLRHLQNIFSWQLLNQQEFFSILETFSESVEKWRLLLDQKDRNDLIYVTSKK